ncbi:SDR family oxidoreductase [Rhodococcus sp. KBS0724]|nr:SDR family oxidoreductase [Rhodococcus sp. KBS0724]
MDGQVALVTGGGGGLGSEAGRRLAASGAHVVFADLSFEAAAAAADHAIAQGMSAQAIDLNVTKSASVERAVEEIERSHGRLDILMTSHGFPRDGRLLDMTDDAWDDVLNVCLTGTFYCIRAAARLMTKRRYGRIITVASRAWHGNPGQANYSAAKAGVIGLTRSVAKEFGRHEVTANAIAPGLIETASLRELDTYDALVERAKRDNSIKRVGQPADVAAAVRFLASPTSGFLTGEVIHVSGGRFG